MSAEIPSATSLYYIERERKREMGDRATENVDFGSGK
jgi:hypothetical protein